MSTGYSGVKKGSQAKRFTAKGRNPEHRIQMLEMKVDYLEGVLADAIDRMQVIFQEETDKMIKETEAIRDEIVKEKE